MFKKRNFTPINSHSKDALCNQSYSQSRLYRASRASIDASQPISKVFRVKMQCESSTGLVGNLYITPLLGIELINCAKSTPVAIGENGRLKGTVQTWPAGHAKVRAIGGVLAPASS